MTLQILYGIEGAKKASGITIIVDIFRAATVEAYLLGQGAKYIIPVKTKEEAFALKSRHSEYILVGEEGKRFGGFQIQGFDFGNSPSRLAGINFANKIIVHRSSQGTQGLLNAKNADEIIFGSFVTLSAITDYLKNRKIPKITVVAMAGKESDDEQFALYLKDIIIGKKPDMQTVIKNIREHPHVRRFLDPNLPDFPSEDFPLCLELNKFSFICKAEKTKDRIKIIKVEQY